MEQTDNGMSVYCAIPKHRRPQGALPGSSGNFNNNFSLLFLTSKQDLLIVG